MKSKIDALARFGAPDLDVEELFRAALAHGGDLAELFLEETQSTRVQFEGGRVDRVIEGTDRGAGLRLIHQGRSIFGYTTDLSRDSLLKLARALASAIGSASSKSWQAPSEWLTPRPLSVEMAAYSIQRSPREEPLSRKIAILKEIDRAARASLVEIQQVTAILMDSYRRLLVINSDGTVAPDEKFYLQTFCEAVAKKGERSESAVRSDGGYIGMEYFDTHSPESIGKEVARRVSVLLNAAPAPAGTLPVVLSSQAGGTMIHEAVGHGLEADLACEGQSVYQGKLGTKIASPLITVVDDGAMPGYRGSYRYDDEGTPARKNVLIENGVLKSYLVDRISAMKFDLPATGNGRRESFRHRPIVRMTNTYIAPGKDDPAEILKSTARGIFVAGMGGGQVDTVSGNFVFKITEAYLIEDGKLGVPIRGATLVGNGPDVLCQIDRVGNDLSFITGTCGKNGQGAPVTDGQPTLRIPAITVGGEVPPSTYWK